MAMPGAAVQAWVWHIQFLLSQFVSEFADCLASVRTGLPSISTWTSRSRLLSLPLSFFASKLLVHLQWYRKLSQSRPAHADQRGPCAPQRRGNSLKWDFQTSLFKNNSILRINTRHQPDRVNDDDCCIYEVMSTSAKAAPWKTACSLGDCFTNRSICLLDKCLRTDLAQHMIELQYQTTTWNKVEQNRTTPTSKNIKQHQTTNKQPCTAWNLRSWHSTCLAIRSYIQRGQSLDEESPPEGPPVQCRLCPSNGTNRTNTKAIAFPFLACLASLAFIDSHLQCNWEGSKSCGISGTIKPFGLMVSGPLLIVTVLYVTVQTTL